MAGFIAGAVNGALTYRKPPNPAWWKPSGWFRSKQGLGDPQVDESVILRAVAEDAKAGAAALDENSEVGPLPLQRVADEVFALSSKIGEAALGHLAQMRQELAKATAAARTAKRTVAFWLLACFQVLLVAVESTTMRMALATAYTVRGAILQWATAIGMAILASIAGYAMAVARIKSLSPETADEADGAVGRGVLRSGWIAIMVSLLLLIIGVVWTRVLYTNDQQGAVSGDSLQATVTVGWEHWIAHVIVIAGLMMLAASVSYTLKALDQVADSALRVRPDVGRQRTRSEVFEMVHSQHAVLWKYVVLERQCRLTVGVAANTWREQFLLAVPPDLHDRWTAYLADHPQEFIVADRPADWVSELEMFMNHRLMTAESLALPTVEMASDRLRVPSEEPRLA